MSRSRPRRTRESSCCAFHSFSAAPVETKELSDRCHVSVRFPYKCSGYGGKNLLHLCFTIGFDIRSAQECSLPGDGAPCCPLHRPGPGAGAVVLPSQQFLRPQPWRSGTIWEQALGPTHRGHAGRLVPLQGQRIPALHLLLLHPFPASAPRGSLCCFLWPWLSLLVGGKMSLQLYINIHMATHLPGMACVAQWVLPCWVLVPAWVTGPELPAHWVPLRAWGVFPPNSDFYPRTGVSPIARGAAWAGRQQVPVPLGTRGERALAGTEGQQKDISIILCHPRGTRSCQSPSGEQ